MVASAIEVSLACGVSFADLRVNLGFLAMPAGKIIIEQFSDVPIAQERFARPVTLLGFIHEQGRQADHGHVMMPSTPHPHLILGHAGLTLGLVKGVLDPEALVLAVNSKLNALVNGRGKLIRLKLVQGN